VDDDNHSRVIASLFAVVRNIQEVAEFTNFATLLAFAGVNASVIKLFGTGDNIRGFKKVLMNIILPGAGVLASLWLASQTGWVAITFGLILLGAGIAAYLLIKAFRRKKSKE